MIQFIRTGKDRFIMRDENGVESIYKIGIEND